MNVLELLTERKRIEIVLKRSGTYVSPIKPDSIEEDNQENRLYVIFERDKKLLNELDEINNVLHKCNAETYINIHGMHLSVATALEYLEQMKMASCQRGSMSFEEKDSFDCFRNPRMRFLQNCQEASDRYSQQPDLGRGICDPNNLCNGKVDYEQKMIDLFIDLQTQVKISNVNTEVHWKRGK